MTGTAGKVTEEVHFAEWMNSIACMEDCHMSTNSYVGTWEYIQATWEDYLF